MALSTPALGAPCLNMPRINYGANSVGELDNPSLRIRLAMPNDLRMAPSHCRRIANTMNSYCDFYFLTYMKFGH